MRFWDETSGAVRLTKAARLYPHMPGEQVRGICRSMLGDAQEVDTRADGDIVALPAFNAEGGRMACLCFLRGNQLHAAEFSVLAVGRRKYCTADRQRAFLFECLRAADPAPDSKRSVLLRCPFGTALVATDPRGGDAILRFTYR